MPHFQLDYLSRLPRIHLAFTSQSTTLGDSHFVGYLLRREVLFCINQCDILWEKIVNELQKPSSFETMSAYRGSCRNNLGKAASMALQKFTTPKSPNVLVCSAPNGRTDWPYAQLRSIWVDCDTQSATVKPECLSGAQCRR